MYILGLKITCSDLGMPRWIIQIFKTCRSLLSVQH